MAEHGSTRAIKKLSRIFGKLNCADPTLKRLTPCFIRSMATEAYLPPESPTLSDQIFPPASSEIVSPTAAVVSLNGQPSVSQVLTTIYSWPALEPLRIEHYPSSHLLLPLRRDILHRAVIYEGDKTRQGTASTKWRSDVHGSNRKIQRQKGTGRARVGDKKSPIRRGGGVAFGPHPRDFSTGLQRKVYDLAWRTALSYRYRRGELIVVGNKISLPKDTGARLLTNIFEGNQWGTAFGRSTLVTTKHRERLFREMLEIRRQGIVKDMFDIDVKDLLHTGRIIIEKQALDTILTAHSSDLGVKHTMKHAEQLVSRPRSSIGWIQKFDEAVEEAGSDQTEEEDYDHAAEQEDEEANAVSQATTAYQKYAEWLREQKPGQAP